MNGEISFDTEIDDNGQDHIEGCYRISSGEWQVFYFTHHHEGALWTKDPVVNRYAVWPSGIRGVNAVYPKWSILNKASVQSILSEISGVKTWDEIVGPDSLDLK